MTVAYEADLERVEQAIEQVNDATIPDPALVDEISAAPASIGVTAMGVNGVHVHVIVTTLQGRSSVARCRYSSRLKSAFDADGIRFSDQTRMRQADLPE